MRDALQYRTRPRDDGVRAREELALQRDRLASHRFHFSSIRQKLRLEGCNVSLQLHIPLHQAHY